MECFYCMYFYSDLNCDHDSKGPDSSSWIPAPPDSSVPADGTPQCQAACSDANQQETATFPSPADLYWRELGISD